MTIALASYLESIPDGAAKSEGVAVGEAVAAKVLAARAGDGSDAPDDYRPRTTPGVYVPTPIMRGPMWPRVKPFALASPSQFRPGPPIALKSKQWATDFDEIKKYGAQKSAKPNTTTISGDPSPPFATATSTATRRPIGTQPGSRSRIRRCTRNIRVPIARSAAASPA
jgi:hypothetical protein